MIVISHYSACISAVSLYISHIPIIPRLIKRLIKIARSVTRLAQGLGGEIVVLQLLLKFAFSFQAGRQQRDSNLLPSTLGVCQAGQGLFPTELPPTSAVTVLLVGCVASILISASIIPISIFRF